MASKNTSPHPLPYVGEITRYFEEQAPKDIRKAIQKGGLEDLESIRDAVEASCAQDYTAKLARDYAERAIACLEVIPANQYRDALVQLCRFAVARTH